MSIALQTLANSPGAGAPIPGLRVGALVLDSPVVLAPMAGITNRAFRRLCRQAGAGLYVSEMITGRALVERNATTMDMIRFAPDEHPRSLQLYGVDPAVMYEAVRIVVDEDRADHIDLNFGCPVPKVTRRGGGSALPWKVDLFDAVVGAALRAADGRVPISVKMRIGIDDDHLTYLEAGRIAAELGVSWVALHARTALQFYSGTADWSAIARLKEHISQEVDHACPVLGNGDIWTADDAIAMVRQTGADGVVVGRGCLGRPWLFAQLAAAFAGKPVPPDPRLPEVLATLRQHAQLLCQEFGEVKGCRDIRKHMAWYLKGFRVRQPVRAALGTVTTLDELDQLLNQVDTNQDFNAEVGAGPRGRTSPQRQVALPERWLDSRLCDEQTAARLLAEDAASRSESATSGG